MGGQWASLNQLKSMSQEIDIPHEFELGEEENLNHASLQFESDEEDEEMEPHLDEISLDDALIESRLSRYNKITPVAKEPTSAGGISKKI